MQAWCLPTVSEWQITLYMQIWRGTDLFTAFTVLGLRGSAQISLVAHPDKKNQQSWGLFSLIGFNRYANLDDEKQTWRNDGLLTIKTNWKSGTFHRKCMCFCWRIWTKHFIPLSIPLDNSRLKHRQFPRVYIDWVLSSEAGLSNTTRIHLWSRSLWMEVLLYPISLSCDQQHPCWYSGWWHSRVITFQYNTSRNKRPRWDYEWFVWLIIHLPELNTNSPALLLGCV